MPFMKEFMKEPFMKEFYFTVIDTVSSKLFCYEILRRFHRNYFKRLPNELKMSHIMSIIPIEKVFLMFPFEKEIYYIYIYIQ